MNFRRPRSRSRVPRQSRTRSRARRLRSHERGQCERLRGRKPASVGLHEGGTSRTRYHVVARNRDSENELSGWRTREVLQSRLTSRRRQIRAFDGDKWQQNFRFFNGSKAWTHGREKCAREGRSSQRNAIGKGSPTPRQSKSHLE